MWPDRDRSSAGVGRLHHKDSSLRVSDQRACARSLAGPAVAVRDPLDGVSHTMDRSDGSATMQPTASVSMPSSTFRVPDSSPDD